MLNMIETFARVKKHPLDSSEIIKTSKLANEYAKSPVAYDGQHVKIVNLLSSLPYIYNGMICNKECIINDSSFEHIIKNVSDNHKALLVYQSMKNSVWAKEDFKSYSYNKYSILPMSDLLLLNNELTFILEMYKDNNIYTKKWIQGSIFDNNNNYTDKIYIEGKYDDNWNYVSKIVTSIPDLKIMPDTAYNKYDCIKLWIINDHYCEVALRGGK